MSKKDIVRAWKDARYRNSLSADELAKLPAHPSGLVELSPEDLKNGTGFIATTYATCTCGKTWNCPTSAIVCGG